MKISERLKLMATHLRSTRRDLKKHTYICHTAARVVADCAELPFDQVWGQACSCSVDDSSYYGNWPEVQFLQELGMPLHKAFDRKLGERGDYVDVPYRNQQLARFTFLQFAILIAEERGL